MQRFVKMKKICIIALIIILTVFTASMTACDSTSGRSDYVYLSSFRLHSNFVLKIKVRKATMMPEPLRHFYSKMTLSEIYDSVKSQSNFEVVKYDDYILVKDLSDKKLGYCLIKPYNGDSFNYVASNMALHVNSPKYPSNYRLLLVPLHLITVPFENRKIDEGEEYSLLGTIEDVASYYEENGYEAERNADSIIVTDITGKNVGGEISFDDVWEKFEIKFTGSKVIYTF